MVQNPRNVVVIGAGTMGSGIAAHLANLGFDVSLLDLTVDSAKAGFEKARKARPPHFYVSETADTVRLGSIAGDIQWVRNADWVCEAIIEKLDAKKSLFSLIEPLLREDAYISTNTSGLEISLLAEGLGASFKRRFLGTHFFNPPRYLKLLELIPTADTDPAVTASMTEFLESMSARRVVLAKDTPGFIANRYGMWCMYHATHCTEKLGLNIEQVDAITGAFMGRPKTGSFRLNDLVGLDIMQDIANNLIARCPNDKHTDVLQSPRSLAFLLEKGWIGDKAGQGYYRREGKELVSLDLNGLGYRMRLEPELPTINENIRKPLGERLKIGLEARDEVGEFMRAFLPPALNYANELRQEISHNIEDFDHVMMWGFGWEAGPFQMMDMVDTASPGHYRGTEYLTFAGDYAPSVKDTAYSSIHDYPIIQPMENFNVRDMGDGVAAISTTTKMGVFTVDLVKELHSYLKDRLVERFVLTSEARVFSAGFDLKFLYDRAIEKQLDDVDVELQNLQNLGLLISQFPCVAAVYGSCLGGGFEMATACSIVAAHPESQIGLPEAKVGLIPGGGGSARIRQRHETSARAVAEAAKVMILGTVSANADDARRYGYLRRQDVTVYHPDRLLSEAKRLALTAVPSTAPGWAQVGGPVNGMVEQAFTDLLKAEQITEHDHVIGEQLKHVFVKATSFEEALAKERAAFQVLLGQGLTIARIKHMLETGRPLRN